MKSFWAPLYDSFNVKIGIVQFVNYYNTNSEGVGYITELGNYYLGKKGSLNYTRSAVVNEEYFKPGTQFSTRIISGSGEYETKTGYFNVQVGEDIRNVYIRFNI